MLAFGEGSAEVLPLLLWSPRSLLPLCVARGCLFRHGEAAEVARLAVIVKEVGGRL